MSNEVIDLAAPLQGKGRPATALSGAGQGGYTAHVDAGIFEEEEINNALTGGASVPAAGHSMGGPAGAAPPATPRCRCRMPCELETSDTDADYGRQYWTCASEGPKCGFFRWADEPAEQLTLELPPVAAYQGGFDFNDPEDQGHEDVQAPKCQCGLQAVTRTSKSDKNPGREFWTCPRDRDEKCNFFQWIDASATGGQQQPGGALGGSMQRQNEKPWATDQGGPQQKRLKSAANEGIEGDLQAELMINKVKCTCGDPASLLTSNSQKNPGRRFYKCPKPQGEQCRFFEWEDEMVLDQHGVPTGTTRGGGSFGGGGGGIGGGGGSFGGGGGFGGSNAGGGTKSGNCYICKEPGHWSSDCPQKSAGRGGGGYGRGGSYQAQGGGGGGGKSGNCYVCGEAGHWSSDCPQKAGRGSGGRGGRTFGSGSYGRGGYGSRGASWS